MSGSPFGSAPADEEMFGTGNDGYTPPDEKDDPFRPIGTYAEGKLVPGSVNKASCVGKCTAIEKKTGPSGPMLVFSYVATEGAFAGRDFDLYVSFSPKARFKLVETYESHGLPLDGPWGKSKAVGSYVILNLQDEEYEQKWSAKLKGIAKHPKGVGYRGAANLPG